MCKIVTSAIIIIALFVNTVCCHAQSELLKSNLSIGNNIINQVWPDLDSLEKKRINRFGEAAVDSLIDYGYKLHLNHIDSALEFYGRAYYISSQKGYHSLVVNSLILTGSYLFDVNLDYGQSKLVFEEAFRYIQLYPENCTKFLPHLYICLGNVHFMEGRFDSSLHNYQQTLLSLEKYEVDAPHNLYYLAFNGMGCTLSHLQRNDQALYYFQKALKNAVAENNSSNMGQVYSNLASILCQMKMCDSGTGYLLKAQDIYRKEKSKEKLFHTYSQMAMILLYGNKIERAKLYIDSVNIIDSQMAWNSFSIVQTMAAFHYLSRNYSKALPYYLRSIALKKKGTTKDLLNTYYTLGTIYDSLNMGHKAYIYQKAFSDLQDSIFNAERVQSALQLETMYNLAQKDKQIAEKEILIIRQYLWLIGIGGTSLLFIVILFYLLNRKRNREEIIRLNSILQGEEKERSRMARELHDGIISKMYIFKLQLENIAQNRFKADINDYQDLLKQIEQSIVEMRATTHNLLPEILEQEGLIGALRLFFTRITTYSNLQVDFEVIGDIPKISKTVEINIYRIIQELTQNAIKHSEATTLLIQLVTKNSYLYVTIEDNGKGINEEEFSANDSIGLRNLRHRVGLLNGTIEITNNEGTCIYLGLDLRALATN